MQQNHNLEKIGQLIEPKALGNDENKQWFVQMSQNSLLFRMKVDDLSWVTVIPGSDSGVI